MKTPRASTKTRLTKPVSGSGALHSWGSEPVRVMVEYAERAAGSSVRARLKEHAKEDYPAGKAVERLRYFGMQRGLLAAPEGGAKRGRDAMKQGAKKLVRAVSAAVQPYTAPPFKAAAQLPVWRGLGPTLIPHGQTYGKGAGATPSVSGRCSGIVVDKGDARRLVLCSAGGGLWGSRDAGVTWTPLTDRQPTLVMGAIAQSDSAPNVLYAATGDGDGLIPYGVGLLRSADGGLTWAHVPATALTGIGVYDLAVDPVDPLKVWIASSAALHVTIDGGGTVRNVLAGPCWSVSVHPVDRKEVLAATEAGLMRSADGGATWSKLSLAGASSSATFTRLEVCHAPSQPDIVYVAGCIGKRALLWRRSAAGGAFAAEVVPTAMNITQAWYDWCLAVAPNDADLVYWGAIELYRGKRGAQGMVWIDISSRTSGDSIHPDQHDVSFDASNPHVVYACNDGGLFRSPDGGDHWQSLNPGLGITEFEFLTQLGSDPAWVFGGTQDNGSLSNGGMRRWDQVALGDGGDCAAVDRGVASICYHSYYDMPIERAAAKGAQAFAWTDVSPPTPQAYAALFYPPLEASGRLVVKAGATVWVSEDEGHTWTEIALPTSGQVHPDLASALAIVGDRTLFVGTVQGRMVRVSKGATWSAATVLPLAAPGNGYVSDIEVVGADARTLWISCSHIGGGHLFRSTDGGRTWANRTANLPDVAVNAVVVDPLNPKTVYAASDRGIYRSQNAGGTWSDFSNGLPNVIVGDLILHAEARLLRAGTRSRGAWEVNI